MRAELSGGLRRVSQDVQVYDVIFDSLQRFVGERQEKLDGISLNLFEASGALVYDNSLLGYTSPFAGQRFRFQITPTIGELRYLQGLADYRRYLFLRPFTLAVRGLHVGRYGRDAEVTEDGQEIFNDFYLGQSYYVRGYYDTFEKCQSQQSSLSNDCDVLSNLMGSRIGVANAELRFPLIQQLVVGNTIGFPPIEGFLFADAGITWDQSTSPSFIRGVPSDPDERGILTSAGVGARVNLFGILVLEVDYVNAFQRDRGWHWQFGFVPGF
jgi:outer membrane protein assembly factor BamA